MTLILAPIILLLVVGMVLALVKRLFRAAVICAIFVLLLLGAMISVISSMH